MSALESAVNIGSGFIIAMVIWQFIAPLLFGYSITLVENFWLTSLFTTVSVVRSYLWRRFFNGAQRRRRLQRERAACFLPSFEFEDKRHELRDIRL